VAPRLVRRQVTAVCVAAAYVAVVPRKPRPEVPGGFFHVCARGYAQAPLFLDDADYEAWLRILARTVDAFSWRCHAYCVMPNHFHLLLDTPQPTRSAGMRHLNGSYAQRCNTRYDGSGHVFQGRYSAQPVLEEPHFLETCRYIVLNPVRAGLRDAPEKWRWNSYRATVGSVRPPAFLTVDTVLAAFGTDVERAQERYRQFVSEGHAPGPGPETGPVRRRRQHVRHASRA
jgi:putative transposase